MSLQSFPNKNQPENSIKLYWFRVTVSAGMAKIKKRRDFNFMQQFGEINTGDFTKLAFWFHILKISPETVDCFKSMTVENQWIVSTDSTNTLALIHRAKNCEKYQKWMVIEQINRK